MLCIRFHICRESINGSINPHLCFGINCNCTNNSADSTLVRANLQKLAARLSSRRSLILCRVINPLNKNHLHVFWQMLFFVDHKVKLVMQVV